MGTLSTWTNGKKLLESIRTCDIVEFNRISYSHFGFYIGNGICVHVQGPYGSSSQSSKENNSKSKSGIKLAERLVDVAGRDLVRINNSELTAFQFGVKKRSEIDAIQLAISGLPTGCNGDVVLRSSISVPYFVCSSQNCEGWSTFWKYDHPRGWSIQVGSLLT